MTVEEIRAELNRCDQLPHGRVKAQLLESLTEQAKEIGDHLLEAQTLLSLSRAYAYSSERERMPVAFGRLLYLLDTFPADVGELSRTIHWMLKWLGVGLIRHPGVPLTTVHRWLDECESRYRQRGYSPRPVHGLRALLAMNIGDDAAASAHMEASIAAPRDHMADCTACEHSDWGTWRAALGDDGGALEYWSPVLKGEKRCDEEPHKTLAKALLPLLRTDRAEEARGAFLRGYPMVRRNISLMTQVGLHAEFCALTGNEGRGLEILAEHAQWLDETQVDADTRLDFITGMTVLLRRLSALGHDQTLAGKGAVRGVLAELEPEIADLCSRFDDRYGNTAVSDRVAARLAQRPLLESLPLGMPVKLPQPSSAHAAPAQPAAPAEAATLDELIAQARRLSEIRHPDTGKAWAKVAEAGGANLPEDVAAQVNRSRAGELLPAQPQAAYELLLKAAASFAALGDLDRELEARATSSIAQEMAGDHEAARESVSATAAAATEAFADGRLTPRHYLNVRTAVQEIGLLRLGRSTERDAADLDGFAAGVEAALATAERLDQRHHIGRCHMLLVQASLWRSDKDGARVHLTAAREAFLAAAEPWHAASPEDYLAQAALQDGDPETAEQLTRDALAHGAAALTPQQAAQLWSMLAEAISRQPGRDADLAAVSLTTAARWDSVSEPDMLHNTFNAAGAYARLGRHDEAVALFEQAIPKVDVPYNTTGIAMTRDRYGRSLRATGRHADAAGQFLEAARLLQDDADNRPAHAMLAALAAEELQHSGQPQAALAAYRRAADLFGALGDTVPRVRCLRSAAWLELSAAEARIPYPERTGVTAMRSVLAELEAAVAADSSPELAAELDVTRKQLTSMLNPPPAEDD